MGIKQTLLLLFTFGMLATSAQQAELYGRIFDDVGKPIAEANIVVNNLGTVSDSKGAYSLSLDEGTYQIIISHVVYENDTFKISLKAGERKNKNFFLNLSSNLIDDVEVVDQRERFTGTVQLNPKEVEMLPSVNEGVEGLLKTLPGVASNNELSSQYSVRGGNFDENLVYLNGIEVYRPFLVRSGQQEGLSFINPDMVSSIRFSAGGFEARYGDKMSSVLDVSYDQPKENFRVVRLSLLGTSATVGGITKNRRLSYLFGFRQKVNRNLLASLDTEADYNTTFNDFQSYLTYYINDDLEVNWFTNYASNQYQVIPKNRQTDFGTLTSALRLTVFFDGQEVDEYETIMSALSATYRPSDDLSLTFIASGAQNTEQEYFDIQGQYRLGDLDANLGSENFGEVVFNRGVGTHLDHARNRLKSRFLIAEHKGLYTKDKGELRWGLRFQAEEITDRLHEWRMIDSAFYSTPTSNHSEPFELHELISGSANLISNRVMAFADYSKDFKLWDRSFFYNVGIRSHYWTYNGQVTISPRASLAYKPDWDRNVVMRLASGFYHQVPIYRELRDFDGSLNPDIKAQQSIHAVAGIDYEFKAWGRPFKFIGEVYYKDLSSLIPYQIENVRVRYYAENNATGFATGVDLKVNGEFVKGIESWASVSLMTIQEDIEGDGFFDADSNFVEAGYIPRPTDQFLNFSIYFQDYLPNNPTIRVNLNLVYGTGLPFGAPNTERYQQTLKLPAYRRVDIGFTKMLKLKDKQVEKLKFLNYLDEAWFSLEVFNLLEIRNTVSYLWVQDISGAEFAVPNFLTSRLVNLKLVAKF